MNNKTYDLIKLVALIGAPVIVFLSALCNIWAVPHAKRDLKLYLDGQVVKLDGDSYRLVIVPNDTTAAVTLKDNGVDRTSVLEYEEGLDKNNNKIVNYIYKISTVSAAHTIVVTCGEGSSVKIFTKVNDAWRELSFTKIYKKINNVWVEQSDLTQIFENGVRYKRE